MDLSLPLQIFVITEWPGSTCNHPGSVRKMENGKGGFDFLGNAGDKQGIHLYWDFFYEIGEVVQINGGAARDGSVVIQNGDQWIVIGTQGYVGLAEDMGNPVLLPPGAIS